MGVNFTIKKSMGTIHGLSINGGKLDIQLSDSQFSKDSNGLLTLTDSFIANAAAGEVAKVVANAPEDLNTLKEIAEYIESDKTGAAELNNAISALQTGKMDKLGVGDGISIKDGVISAVIGQGLEFYGQDFRVKAGRGLGFYDGALEVKTRRGFEYNDEYINVYVGSGLKFDDNNSFKIALPNYSGLTIVDEGLKISTGPGIDINSDGRLYVKVSDLAGDNLVWLPTGKIYVDTYNIAGAGLMMDPDNNLKLSLQIGTSLKLTETGLEVNANKGLIDTETGLSVNTGYSLNVDTDNYLEVKPGHGIFVSNQGVNVKPGFGIETNDAGVCVQYGTGLAIDEISNALYIPISTGLQMVDRELCVAFGNGLKSEIDGNIEISLHDNSGLMLTDTKLKIGSGTVNAINGANNAITNTAISAIINTKNNVLEFKLSTGLAVDKDGYLYVDTTQLAKTSSEA